MFEVGFTEILLILGIALLVLGPEKLPGLAEKVGRWTGRARAMARQLRTQLEHEVTMEEMTRSRATSPPPPPPENPPESTVAASATPAHPGPELDLDAAVSGIEPTPPHGQSPEDAAADAALAADAPLPKSAP
jgi:sec-independent protein translocase protein TatB